MKILVELNRTSSPFDNQFCNRESKTHPADIRSGVVATGEETIENFDVFSRGYSRAFILNACLEPGCHGLRKNDGNGGISRRKLQGVVHNIHKRNPHQAAINADFYSRQLKMLLNDAHTTLLAQNFQKSNNFRN